MDWTLDLGSDNVPYTPFEFFCKTKHSVPPPESSVDFNPPETQTTTTPNERDPLNPSFPSTVGCSFPTYAVRYPDLMDQYGTNVKGYIEDYLLRGASAGRNCAPDATIWNAPAYQARYVSELAHITNGVHF